MSTRSLPGVAVVGTGLSGLVVAHRLRNVAHVTIYEKSRGPGGRMATRRAGDFEFDHGAQFFTARTRAFREFLRPLVEYGVIADWRADFAELDRTRGGWVPRRTADGSWTLLGEADRELGCFDWVVLTAPAEQTARLGHELPALRELGRRRRMRACFALMLGFAEPLQLPWQAALVRDADISWISVNSSKPGRKPPFTLVIHSTNAWANAHMDDATDVVLAQLLEEACAVTDANLDAAVHRQVHRWRYANIDKQSGPACFIDDDVSVAACGDWFVRGRVESAFTSASELATQLLDRL